MKTNRFFCWPILTLLFVLGSETPSLGAHRLIEFAGRQWQVKSGTGMGPGPNAWSDSNDSVWVDAQGLHLKIRNIGGVWHCAEVTSVTPTTNGLHRFYVQGRYDQLDPNIVFSPFLYADDTHEIDIEMSRWGSATNMNTQFVVQPYGVAENMVRFNVGDARMSTHYIDWQPTNIVFKSFKGHSPEPVAPGDLLREWNYAGPSIPSSSLGLRIHINLWLFRGLAPSDGEEAEVVIKDVDYPGKGKPAPPGNGRVVR